MIIFLLIGFGSSFLVTALLIRWARSDTDAYGHEKPQR